MSSSKNWKQNRCLCNYCEVIFHLSLSIVAKNVENYSSSIVVSIRNSVHRYINVKWLGSSEFSLKINTQLFVTRVMNTYEAPLYNRLNFWYFILSNLCIFYQKLALVYSSAPAQNTPRTPRTTFMSIINNVKIVVIYASKLFNGLNVVNLKLWDDDEIRYTLLKMMMVGNHKFKLTLLFHVFSIRYLLRFVVI